MASPILVLDIEKKSIRAEKNTNARINYHVVYTYMLRFCNIKADLPHLATNINSFTYFYRTFNEMFLFSSFT